MALTASQCASETVVGAKNCGFWQHQTADTTLWAVVPLRCRNASCCRRRCCASSRAVCGGHPLSAVANSCIYVFAEVLCTPPLLMAAKDEVKLLCHVPHTGSTAARASLTLGPVRGGGGG